MSVDPARLKDAFSEALARTDPAARAAYLDAACAGDADLRSRVEALLRASEDPNSLLDASRPVLPDDAIPTGTFDGPGSPAVTDHQPPSAEVGAVVAGKYKLLQQIGEGGLGTVWMADQTEPVKRRVAVKLVRAERGASRTILSRFEAERQAIALMNHPNIAKLLDAGTTAAGTPFFVMELVKGVPLTDYCDAHKLSVADWLGLFRQICAAVHHAQAGRTAGDEPVGLHEVLGNLVEICADEFGELPPGAHTDFLRTGTHHAFHVIRGHCYYSLVMNVGGTRGRLESCCAEIGFRVAVSP
jgi:hypothetical protein